MPERRPTVVHLLALGFASVVVWAPLQAQTFDRFFTTAAERLLLDEARRELHDPTPLPAPVVDAPTSAPAPSGPVVPRITLSGVVIRRGGQDTTWINGSGMRPDELTPEGIRVAPERGPRPSVQIVLPATAEPIRLRPGQQIDLVTGAVLEAYQHDASDDSRSVFEDPGATGSGSASGDGGKADGNPGSSAASGG